MSVLKKVEIMALTLLHHRGFDQVGVIDDENKFAAALLYESLKKQGLVMSVLQPGQTGGPLYYITAKGQRALDGSR